jgi:phosphatidylglycerol---prolipoprotein diacylglyceryl transferase
VRPILFHLGELAVPSFWVAAFLGFAAAFVLVRSEVLRHGYDREVAYDFILAAYVGGWVGARLFLIPTGWQFFSDDPIGFLLASSGWVWQGGVIGGAIGVLYMAHRRGVPLLVAADICAPGLAVGLAIGRIGCQLAGDGDYGIPSTLPWAMSYPDGVVPTTERVHPTPIYEMLANLAILGYLWRHRRRGLAPGDMIGRYLVLSSVVRFLVEFVRRNPSWLAGLTTAQWMSVAFAVLGVVLVRRAAGRPSGAAGPRAERESPVAGSEAAA